MKTNYQEVRMMWDRIGVGLSGLCLIHCLLLPVLVTLLPWLGEHFEDERVHLMFAALTVPVALIAFVPNFLRFRRRGILALGLAGAACLMTGALAHDLVGETGEHLLTILGGVLLITGHLQNYRLGSLCCSGELCSNAGHSSHL